MMQNDHFKIKNLNIANCGIIGSKSYSFFEELRKSSFLITLWADNSNFGDEFLIRSLNTSLNNFL